MDRLHTVTASLLVLFTAACVMLTLLAFSTRQAQAADSFPDTPGGSVTGPAVQAPTLVAPSDGAAVGTTTPQLVWESTGASAYLVHISRSASLDVSDGVLWTWTSGTTFDMPPGVLAPDSTYYWSVLGPPNAEHSFSVQQAGGYAWGQIWSFNTGTGPAIPPVPTLSAPADEGLTCLLLGNTLLSWLDGGDEYKVQVSTNETIFTNPHRVVSEVIAQNTYTITAALDSETVYYWRVKARFIDGDWSDWSEVRRFTPTCLVSPVDGDTETAPVTLAWVPELTTGAVTLDLLVDDDPSLASPEVYDVQGLTSYPVPAPPLVDGQTYYWALDYWSGTGSSVLTAVRSFTATTLPPPSTPPELESPPDAPAVELHQPITLDWLDHAEADSYRLEYFSHPFSLSGQVLVPGLTESRYVIGGLEEGTIYSWRVQAVNAGGEGPWSFQRSLLTYLPAPAEAPALVSPSDGSVEVALQPTFEWTTTPRGRRYKLQVTRETDATFANPVIDIETTGLLYATPAAEALDPLTGYHWRVQAVNDNGEGSWAEPPSPFTTELPVPVPHTPVPADGATDQGVALTLSWTGEATVEGYDLEVSLDAHDFSEPVISTSVEGESLDVDALTYGTSYSWRVRAWRGTKIGAWGGPWHFDTGFDPNAPAVLPLTGALEVPTTLNELNWDAEYTFGWPFEVSFGTDPRFETTLIHLEETFQESVAIPPGLLDPGTTYYWRIDPTHASLPTLDLYFTTAGQSIDRVTLSHGYWQVLPGTNIILCHLSYWLVEGMQSYVLETTNGQGTVATNVIIPNTNHPVDRLGCVLNINTQFKAQGASWRMQACSDTGGQTCGPWSEYRALGNNPQGNPPPFILQKPGLISPAPGEAVTFPLTFRWSASPHATDYNVEIYNADPTPFPSPGTLVESTTTSQLAWTLAQDPDPSVATLYWRAQACLSDEEGGQDCSDWTAARRFVTNADLAAPTLVSPIGGVAHQPIPVTLDWNAVANPDADYYAVEVARDEDFTALVATETPTLDAILLDNLAPDTEYFWRVKAWKHDGQNSPWSVVARFRTDIIPQVPPGPVFPAQDQQDVPLPLASFTWQASPDLPPTTGFYAWRIAEGLGINADSLLEEATDLPTASHQAVSVFSGGQVYTWQVQACTGAGCSSWSQPEWHFTTEGGLTLSPALLDFGQVTVGQSAGQVVVLGNTGASALLVNYAMDPQGSEFVFVANAGGPHGGTVVLLPGQPDSLRVSFGPEGEGHRTATVLFEDGQQVVLGSVLLQGEGVSSPVVQRYYYVTDHLGSVRATVDEGGVVVHYDDYYPFGAPMPGRGMDDAAPRERFTGHEVEDDLDPDYKAVYYAGARYYDGLLGRWDTVDPKDYLFPSHSPYNYVFNNPVNLTDPDGECPECWAFLKGAARGALDRAKSNIGDVVTAVQTSEGRDGLLRGLAPLAPAAASDERSVGAVYSDLYEGAKGSVEEGVATLTSGSAEEVGALVGAAAVTVVVAALTRKGTKAAPQNLNAKNAFRGVEPGNPALRDNPYSPREVSRRQSALRRQEGAKAIDPDAPIPDRPPGHDLGGHTSQRRPRHRTGERNVASDEEHSRVPKGYRSSGGQ